MSAKKFFLDTNIIVYTFDQTAPHKQKIAQQLLEQTLSGEGCIYRSHAPRGNASCNAPALRTGRWSVRG